MASRAVMAMIITSTLAALVVLYVLAGRRARAILLERYRAQRYRTP